jgi:hypothetical protein
MQDVEEEEEKDIDIETKENVKQENGDKQNFIHYQNDDNDDDDDDNKDDDKDCDDYDDYDDSTKSKKNKFTKSRGTKRKQNKVSRLAEASSSSSLSSTISSFCQANQESPSISNKQMKMKKIILSPIKFDTALYTSIHGSIPSATTATSSSSSSSSLFNTRSSKAQKSKLAINFHANLTDDDKLSSKSTEQSMPSSPSLNSSYATDSDTSLQINQPCFSSSSSSSSTDSLLSSFISNSSSSSSCARVNDSSMQTATPGSGVATSAAMFVLPFHELYMNSEEEVLRLENEINELKQQKQQKQLQAQEDRKRLKKEYKATRFYHDNDDDNEHDNDVDHDDDLYRINDGEPHSKGLKSNLNYKRLSITSPNKLTSVLANENDVVDDEEEDGFDPDAMCARGAKHHVEQSDVNDRGSVIGSSNRSNNGIGSGSSGGGGGGEGGIRIGAIKTESNGNDTKHNNHNIDSSNADAMETQETATDVSMRVDDDQLKHILELNANEDEDENQGDGPHKQQQGHRDVDFENEYNDDKEGDEHDSSAHLRRDAQGGNGEVGNAKPSASSSLSSSLSSSSSSALHTNPPSISTSTSSSTLTSSSSSLSMSTDDDESWRICSKKCRNLLLELITASSYVNNFSRTKANVNTSAHSNNSSVNPGNSAEDIDKNNKLLCETLNFMLNYKIKLPAEV